MSVSTDVGRFATALILSPAAARPIHVVAMREGETHEQALARVDRFRAIKAQPKTARGAA